MSLDSDRKYHLHSLLHLLVLMWHPYLWLTISYTTSRITGICRFFWILYLKECAVSLEGMDKGWLAAYVQATLEAISWPHGMGGKTQFFKSRIISLAHSP